MGLREDFEHCIAGGGVVVFPADTVYGLACDPDDEAAVRRLYTLKGRAPDKPAATMYFSVEALPPLSPRVAAAARALLPGPVTLVVGQLGLRVPDLPLLQGAAVVVLQSSANHAGGPEARRLQDVPEDIRRGADLLLDGGELPGTPSTVLDLTRYEADGTWTVLREGAVSAASLAEVL
jgi:L-threonylcarbamoyladenylate synthase